MKQKAYCTFIFLLCFLVISFPVQAQSNINEKFVPDHGVLWGASVNNDDGTVIQEMGRPFDIYHIYHDWKREFPTEKHKNLINKKGKVLYFTWAPRVYSTGETFSWKEIAEGTHDDVIDRAARNLKDLKQKVFLSFHDEMDGKKGDHQDPEDYRKAYRRIVERFQKAGAKNVIFVWTVTGYKGNWQKLDKLYPGNDVVDWIAWDPYNWSDCRNEKWKSFKEIIHETYQFMTKTFPDKPLMLAEYGSVENPNDPQARANWFREIPKQLKEYPQLKAVVYFNSNDEKKGCDWRINTKNAIKGFVEASKDPYVNVLHSQNIHSPNDEESKSDPSPLPKNTADHTPKPKTDVKKKWFFNLKIKLN